MDKLICVVGPTASGKTALAVKLAKALDGEVVSCDSMQIYRRMDIGTAKPTAGGDGRRAGTIMHRHRRAGRRNFPWGTTSSWRMPAVQDILARGKVCVIAGGTGLYVDSLIAGRTLRARAVDRQTRSLWRRGCAPRAAKRCCGNCRRSTRRPRRGCIRRMRSASSGRSRSGRRQAARSRSTTARRRRSRRATHRCGSGWISQIGPISTRASTGAWSRCWNRDFWMRSGALLASGVPETATSLQAIGYKEFFAYLRGEATLEEATALCQQRSRNYAKRQLTWFRRNPAMHWIFQPAQPDADAVFAAARREIPFFAEEI